MAIYNPPQPTWKRVTAGTLDFVLAFGALAYLLGTYSSVSNASSTYPYATSYSFNVNLSGLPAILFLTLLVAYFVVLGRTGGTLFQRLFGMKRAQPAAA